MGFYVINSSVARNVLNVCCVFLECRAKLELLDNLGLDEIIVLIGFVMKKISIKTANWVENVIERWIGSTSKALRIKNQVLPSLWDQKLSTS